jgi:hypothetical protein
MALRDEFGYTSKTVNTGDWNMDTTDFINVAHGLTATEWKTIKSVEVILRSDADTKYLPLTSFSVYGGGSAGIMDGGITGIDATSFSLSRTATGPFDDPAFSATSFNRGFVTYKYIAD